MNTITVTGMVQDEPQVKEGDGWKLLSFTVIDEKEVKDKTIKNYWQCTLWGKIEEAQKWMQKHDIVSVTGNAGIRVYDKKDGTKGSSLQVRAIDVGLVLKGDAPPPVAAPAPAAPAPAPSQAQENDEALPF